MAHYPWEKSYPPGVRWELEIPKKTIHQIFEESCARFGDRHPGDSRCRRALPQDGGDARQDAAQEAGRGVDRRLSAVAQELALSDRQEEGDRGLAARRLAP